MCRINCRRDLSTDHAPVRFSVFPSDFHFSRSASDTVSCDVVLPVGYRINLYDLSQSEIKAWVGILQYEYERQYCYAMA